MRVTVFVMALALAGCNTTEPAVRVETVEVKVPVPVACIDADDIPPEPPRISEQLNGNAGHDLDIVAQSALELRSALRKTRALLLACVGD